MVTTKIATGAAATSTAVNELSGLITIEAGENISAGNVVYIHLTDGKAYVSDTGTANDIRANGIALTTVSSGSDVDVLTRGVYTTSGLTDKQDYYLGAAGAYSTTLSGVRIGTALSTTQLYVQIVQDDKDAVGTIKPIAVSLSGVPSNNITAFWKVCAGAVLSDTESPLNGTTLPDLNVTQRFLRGATTSGTTGGSDTHTHTLTEVTSRAVWDTGEAESDYDVDAGSTLPAYYQVVFYIKVK